MAAAKDVLDRGGFAKTEKVEVSAANPLFILPEKVDEGSGGKAFDENKSDFATPLYWLTKNNGDLFPATTILIIHHANKNVAQNGAAVDPAGYLEADPCRQVRFDHAGDDID